MPSIAAYDFPEFIETVCFLKDRPAFALADGTLRLPAGGETSLVLHEGGLLSAVYDSSGKRLLTGGEDGRVVATIDGEQIEEIAAIGRRWIGAVAGGPNGAVGFASGRSAYVVPAKGALKELKHPRTVEGLAFAPKGLRVATAHYDGASLFFPATDAGPAMLGWKGAHLDAAFSPDGRFLVTIMQENALHGWRLDDGKHMRMTGYPAKVKDWSWSAKGKFLATSGAPAAILWPFSGKDGPMGKAPIELGTRGNAMVTAVACHPAEDMLAIGYNDGMILAVRFADSKEALLRRGGSSPVRTMAWDRAGRLLAFGAESGEAGVVDIAG
ncbi:WD40 repeat domain-containing protein [Jiella sp. MQZ9-1]|uniref:WD40 repeat domain-containing protein n=1 Tax=Jiella flava TaxID=2816857 RepID=A0A939G1L2_9HYPH|nr:WD40 repeat domain-containing protein [Jiella flava]MBO0663883.1 WD40 repeat domain-containing protein [Jiella flava]MCD2472455.1 WD40 repeat domain-containing protein [Jiella flava]